MLPNVRSRSISFSGPCLSRHGEGQAPDGLGVAFVGVGLVRIQGQAEVAGRRGQRELVDAAAFGADDHGGFQGVDGDGRQRDGERHLEEQLAGRHLVHLGRLVEGARVDAGSRGTCCGPRSLFFVTQLRLF